MNDTEMMIRAFTAFRETVRAIAARPESPTGPGGGLSPDALKQFNALARKANVLLGDQIISEFSETSYPGLTTYPPVAEVLGRTNLALELLTEMPGAAQSAKPAVEYENQKRPRVFIGCSIEGLDVAKLIQMQLVYKTDAVIWSQGLFGLSSGTLETLVAQSKEFDFAVLVLTPDDLAFIREDVAQVARDNVLFEMGLFMGAIGRESTFMVVQRGVRLPTDLAGITPAIFDNPKLATDKVAAVGPITTRLELAMGLI